MWCPAQGIQAGGIGGKNVEKERIIKGRLQRLIEEIKKADWEDCDKEYMARLAEERIDELQQSGVNCVDRFVHKLLDRIGDKEQYFDILMEGRFAIILARNNFSDIEIEYCDKGPDLKSRWNRKTVYFEVTRKRPSEDDKLFSQPGAHWAKHSKSEDIIGKIQGKLPQLKPGEINIVVLWSDTLAWNQVVLREAHKDIQQEFDQNPEAYKKLSGILFTEGGGVSPERLTPFCLFRNDRASKPLKPRLARKLKSLYERNPEQLKREFEELAEAIQRLRSSNLATP